jgi:hypothetical protein
MDNHIDSSLTLQEGVKKQPTDIKDIRLKTRLRTLIDEKGFKSEAEFFQSIGITRHHWFRISWGLDECPIHLKIKIAKALNVDSSIIFSCHRKLTQESRNSPASPSSELNEGCDDE